MQSKNFGDTMNIHCCRCNGVQTAKLVSGAKTYPHRKDLAHKKFWMCERCNEWVGAHQDSGMPLGVIPDYELKQMRIGIHAIIDSMHPHPFTREQVYAMKTQEMGGQPFHTAMLRSKADAQKAYTTATFLRQKYPMYMFVERQQVDICEDNKPRTKAWLSLSRSAGLTRKPRFMSDPPSQLPKLFKFKFNMNIYGNDWFKDLMRNYVFDLEEALQIEPRANKLGWYKAKIKSVNKREGRFIV